MQLDSENSRLAEKERYFREFAVWPVFSELDSERWLANFQADERRVAERLLTNFCYFNEQMTDALLKSAIQRYFGTLADQENPPVRKIDDYVGETAFVICEGEQPHPTDSGHLFARKLRDRLGVPESQIFSPSAAIDSASRFSRFVFVDDFTGSGNQFLDTWKAQHRVGTQDTSFKELSNQTSLSFAYCCCIAASKANTEISKFAQNVALHPAHQLSEDSNAVSPTSRIWEGLDAPAAIQKVKQASTRAGYGAEDCGQDDWRGFHCLGLTLAFNHGIPDASLPIFFSQRNGWNPLITRPDHD